jgi:hypothetical protein
MITFRTLFVAGALAAGLALAGCQSGGAGGGITIGGPGTVEGDVVSFTLSDMAKVDAIAEANPTGELAPQIIQCYPAAKAWLLSLPGASAGIQVSGLLSFAYNGLLVVNTVQQGIPDGVYNACGPLYFKAHTKFLAVLARGAAILHP